MILESQYRKFEKYLAYLKYVQSKSQKKLKENNSSVTSTIWLCESFKSKIRLKIETERKN
jgi:hypothetical protein